MMAGRYSLLIQNGLAEFLPLADAAARVRRLS